MPTITLYSKPGCHLCDVVKSAADAVARRRGAAVVVRNILDDPADYEKYRHEIPVVVVGGVELPRRELTQAGMEAALGRGV